MDRRSRAINFSDIPEGSPAQLRAMRRVGRQRSGAGVHRTTIEMSQEHRASLVELAARRGHKGFSRLIAEALDVYLQIHAALSDARKHALTLESALSPKDVKVLRSAMRAIRASGR